MNPSAVSIGWAKGDGSASHNTRGHHDIISTSVFIMSRSTYTRSGTRRLGDDYQDIIGCEVAVDWLEHSDRYSWIRVEADDAKFLDDIVVMRADGRVEVKQVKFSTHPSGANDPFTWEKLLAESESKSGKRTQSLAQEWAVSLRQLEGICHIADGSGLNLCCRVEVFFGSVYGPIPR